MNLFLDDSSGRSATSTSTSSPFDEAAARPLLGEPAKKKFSLFALSPCKNKMSEKPVSVAYRNHSSPSTVVVTQSIDFSDNTSSSSYDEEMGNILERAFAAEISSLDLEEALWHERDSQVQYLNTSMIELNELQRDLAVSVEEQGERVHTIANLAQDAYGHATAGVQYLIALQQRQRKRKREAISAIAAVLAIIVVVLYCLAAATDGEGGSTSSGANGPSGTNNVSG
jgi:hypothetical protein